MSEYMKTQADYLNEQAHNLQAVAIDIIKDAELHHSNHYMVSWAIIQRLVQVVKASQGRASE